MTDRRSVTVATPGEPFEVEVSSILPQTDLSVEVAPAESEELQSRQRPLDYAQLPSDEEGFDQLGREPEPAERYSEQTPADDEQEAFCKPRQRAKPAVAIGKDVAGAQAALKAADAVCFDVDSTVIRHEGIDELADYLGCREQVAAVTASAMGGAMPFDEALEKRLAVMKPALTETKLAEMLSQNPVEQQLTPEVAELISDMQRHGKRVYLVSGGFRQMIEPVAEAVGVRNEDSFANKLLFGENGSLEGHDQDEPTSQAGGKARVVADLRAKYGFKTVVMIGDGATDMEARDSPHGADFFIGFGGVTAREQVRNGADWFVTSFDDLRTVFESKSFVAGLKKRWPAARDELSKAMDRDGTRLVCVVLLQAVCAVGIAARGPGVGWLGWIVHPNVFTAVGGLGVFGSLVFFQNERRDLIGGVVVAALLALASLFEVNAAWLGGFNAGCACAVVGFVLTSRVERGAWATELFVLLVAWFVGSVLTILPAAVFATVDKGTTDGGATLGALGVFIFTFVLWLLGWAFLWYEAPKMQRIEPEQQLVSMPADSLVRLKVRPCETSKACLQRRF